MKIETPEKLKEYLWTRYLPESTYKTYLLIGYLNQGNVEVEDYEKELLNADLGEENTIPKVLDEKKRILNKLGIDYPESREDDLEILLKFKLIEEDRLNESKAKYRYVRDVKKPEEVLDLDDEEKRAIEHIKFEMDNSRAINMILSLVFTNGKRLDCPITHIINMTNVKIADVRLVLNFLVNEEKSLKFQASKDISKLKKQDRVILSINEEVFNEKRFVLEQ